MQYINFTKELLRRFPDFRVFYLEEKKANEVDLLPSNIEFAFIEYYDHSGSEKQNLVINELITLLDDMKDSSDEELLMLYNETINDINNTSTLKEIFKSKNIPLLLTDPYRALSEKDIQGKLLKKRIEVDFKGNKYIEENKKILDEYNRI